MSGRAISILTFIGANLRVAGEMTFVPAHFANGKINNAKVTIPVQSNRRRGENEKKYTFSLTAWGKLAETCCKSLPRGKAIDVRCEPTTFSKKLFRFDQQRGVAVPVLDAQGQQVEAPNFVGFTIREIIFGEESAKRIGEEIQEGKRPANWNVPGHPDYQMWLDRLKARQAAVFNPQTMVNGSKFGFARVLIPQGMQVAPPDSQAAPVAQPGQTMTDYASEASHQFPQQVQQAVNAQPQQGYTQPSATQGQFDQFGNPTGGGQPVQQAPAYGAGGTMPQASGQDLF